MQSRSGALSRKMNFLLPLTVIFTLCGIAYTFKWNADRKNDGACVDCVRQREIVEEIYFNKRPAVQKGYRL